MNKASIALVIGLVLVAAVVIVLVNSAFIVNEREQVIVLQFGKPVGDSITKAGLHFKKPFVQDVQRLSKMLLEWDGESKALYTGGTGDASKERIAINTWARWKIVDALKFYTSLRIESEGQGILDQKINRAVKDVVASYSLYEVLRHNKDRLEYEYDSEELKKSEIDKGIEIGRGRAELTRDILKRAKEGLEEEYGIDLIDVRIKYIHYVRDTIPSIYDRMRSERTRIADRYRSEGVRRAEEIEGQIEHEKARIESEGYKEAAQIRGKADAAALKIYADAYKKDPEFYAFLKTLETYEKTIGRSTHLILSTDSEFFKYLKDSGHAE